MPKITSTFKHLDGIGDKKEFEIWRNGILNWDEYIDDQKHKSLFFDNDLKLSIEALESYDVGFFTDRLDKKDYFRLALSFPKNVMFLDIETTGLSFYYDHITMIGWSLNGKYSFYINSIDKKKKFIGALSKAKVIITFNGTKFDLPFIKQEFKDAIFPKCHIDLMYMCRRLGLKGGQKIIENKINFKRPKGLQDKSGYEATIFWDMYKWGDKSSLVNLIKYNFYDIKGMSFIFDNCVKELYKKEKYNRFFKIDMKFFKNFSKLDLKEIKNFVKQHDIPFDPKSILKFNDLKTRIKRDFNIVGIDLTGSEEKASGIALLQNNQVITELLKKDDEIVRFILKNGVDLVSIDSPLSLPKGRISVYDDDPGREKYGIMRECEKVLKKRGVNAYPTLIQSMQKLTKRGIELANRLRKLGIPVIESYPGVVQDIIGLPRKQVSLDLLKKGLKIFGLEGDFEKKDISHDEIDAITSALVGVFFLSKDFEAIGTIDENFMIIPDLKANRKKRVIYGIAGEIASGKTTIAKYLKNKGFKYIRYSQILSKLLKNQGKVVNRENLQKIGEEFHKNNQYELSKLVYNEIKNDDKIVIDGLRHLEDYTFWYEIFGSDFKLIYVNSAVDVRKKRFLEIDSNLNFNKICYNLVESNVCKLKEKADISIENNYNSIYELYNRLDLIGI